MESVSAFARARPAHQKHIYLRIRIHRVARSSFLICRKKTPSQVKQAQSRPRAKLRPKFPTRNSFAIFRRGWGRSVSDRAGCLGPGNVVLIRKNLVACFHQSKNLEDAAVRRSGTADTVQLGGAIECQMLQGTRVS
jgi:hypothetical protein